MNTIRKEEYPLFLKAMPIAPKENLCETLIDMGVIEISNTQGMIMMSAIDCFDTPFHIGEILVREIKVQIDNQFGIGIAQGDSYEDAFITAAADAADTGGNTVLAGIIAKAICEYAHCRANAEAVDRGIALTTKVNFGLMTEG